MMEKEMTVGDVRFSNRVTLQPMEGCDCNTDGSPSELTIEKYRKAAQSGAEGVWFETLLARGRKGTTL